MSRLQHRPRILVKVTLIKVKVTKYHGRTEILEQLMAL